MIIADFGRLGLLLSIPLTHLVTGLTPLYILYVVQAGVSVFSAVFDASYGACLPNIVGTDQLREANSILQTSMSLSKMIGPFLGGMAISWIGSANTIFVDVGSYFISIVSMLAIVKSFSVNLTKNNKITFMQDVREGLQAVWSIKPVRYLMLFATLVNFVGPGMDVSLLYRIQHELVLGSQWAGIIMTGLSGGMLLGSLVHRWVGKRIHMGRWLTISSILQVAPPIVLSVTNNLWVIFLIQIFIGVLLVAWNIQSVTLRQLLIPDHLLGRSSSAFRLLAWISIPLGDGLAGIIGQHFGTQIYFILAASVLFVVAVLTVCVRLDQAISYAVKPMAPVNTCETKV